MLALESVLTQRKRSVLSLVMGLPFRLFLFFLFSQPVLLSPSSLRFIVLSWQSLPWAALLTLVFNFPVFLAATSRPLLFASLTIDGIPYASDEVFFAPASCPLLDNLAFAWRFFTLAPFREHIEVSTWPCFSPSSSWLRSRIVPSAHPRFLCGTVTDRFRAHWAPSFSVLPHCANLGLLLPFRPPLFVSPLEFLLP